MEGWCCSHLFPWGQRDHLVAAVRQAQPLKSGLRDRTAEGLRTGWPAGRLVGERPCQASLRQTERLSGHRGYALRARRSVRLAGTSEEDLAGTRRPQPGQGHPQSSTGSRARRELPPPSSFLSPSSVRDV